MYADLLLQVFAVSQNLRTAGVEEMEEISEVMMAVCVPDQTC
jgi:hypothetical protein